MGPPLSGRAWPLLEEGQKALLEEQKALEAYKARHGRTEQEWRNKVLGLPQHLRSAGIAELNAQHLHAELRRAGKCERCMFQRKYCICERLASLRVQADEFRLSERVRFAVWMHPLERKRASNTGKLLEHLLPNSLLLAHGVQSDEDRLREAVAAAKGRALVLFPSEDALPAPQALAALPADEEGVPLLAVLVDGTWKQAKRMHHVLEGLPHVALTSCLQSEFHWRRQSQEGRISTVEAAAYFLEELGEARKGVPALIHRALQELCAALERQCHYDTLASHEQPEPSMRKKSAQGAKLGKARPGHSTQQLAEAQELDAAAD